MIPVTVISLFVVAIFILMLKNVFDKKTRIRRIAKRGIEAKAVLLNITRPHAGKSHESRLQIQVYPETGRNFVTEVSDEIDIPALHDYRVGDAIMVKYNPVNTNEIVIVSGKTQSL